MPWVPSIPTLAVPGRGVSGEGEPPEPAVQAVRAFDGSDDAISVTAPAWASDPARTLVAVVKRSGTAAAWHAILSIGASHTDTDAPAIVWEFMDSGTSLEYQVGGMHREHGTGWGTLDAWRLCAISFPGSAGDTFRFHRYDGSSWLHAASTSTTGSYEAPADWGSAVLRFGKYNNSFNFLQGRIAVAAWFDANLNDGQVEALAGGDRSSWTTAGAAHLWEFNQADTGDPVTDLVGNCDEADITGTTVVTDDTPASSIYVFA